VAPFSLEDKVVDFSKISENLKHFDMNPRSCKKLWEGIRKELQESYKGNFASIYLTANNEFVSACKASVKENFWSETAKTFEKRVNVYDRALVEFSDKRSQSEQIEKYANLEFKISALMEAFLNLSSEPEQLHELLSGLKTKLDDVENEMQVDWSSDPSIDSLLSEINADLGAVESDLKAERYIDDEVTLNLNLQEWTISELLNFVRAVCKNGEGDWKYL
jgi:hypothetical protein